MPHDLKGQRLRVGDKVNVPCVITAIHDEKDSACNLSVDTVHPVLGGTAQMITIGSQQVKKSIAKG